MNKLYLGDQCELFKNINDNSVDAIITDPPYGLDWSHKIETKFDFEGFIENSFRVLKDDGFLVYFGQEPTMSKWNVVASKYFKYLSEIIWFKRGQSNPFLFPLRVHEKIVIFTKGKGKLKVAKIDWAWEKSEHFEYVQKDTLLRAILEIKKFIKGMEDIDDLKAEIDGDKYKGAVLPSKTNDKVYKSKGRRAKKYVSFLAPKRLTTLWGCRPHNHQGYNKEEFNIKHPTVKPVQIIERLIEMTTAEGQVVLDPFMGSGTTGIACSLLKRNFVGFEVDKDYFEISKKRLRMI